MMHNRMRTGLLLGSALALALLTSCATHSTQPANQVASTPVTAEETAYRAAIEKRTADILALLDIADAKRSAKVHDIIVAQYRALRDWHDVNDARLKGATAEESQPINATLRALHEKFIASLSANLTPAQVEKVKDKMTYNKVQVTHQGYLDMLPELTDMQKAKIIVWLREAREEAMDGGSAEEKSAIFNRYKGKINNYLSAEGYDLKQAGRIWNERLKARKAAPPERDLQ
jgi:hypothetical protein